MTTAAQLVVKISADGAKETKDDLKGVSDATDSAGDHTHTLLDTMAGFVGGSAIVSLAGDAFGFLKDQVTDSFNAGIEANQVLAQITAGLKSTHDASGETADGLDKMAEKLSNTTGITKSAVEASQSMLLTFTEIGKQTFPQATQAVADIATKMAKGAIPNMDQMQQASIMLGKALNDPVKGAGMLNRVGIQLTDQEKAQIKTMMAHNDIAGAQAVILGEVGNQFKNSATAAGQANGGLAILNAQFENMKESLGQQLIPIMGQLLGAIQPIASGLLSGLGGAISGITPLFAQLEGAAKSLPLAQMARTFQILAATAETVGQQIESAALPVLKQLGEFFTAHLLPSVQAFTGFAAAVLVPMFGQIATFLLSTVVPALLQLAGFVTDTVLPAVEDLVAFFRSAILPVLMTVVSVVAQNVLPVLENLAKIILTQVLPPIEQIAGVIIPILIPAFQAIGWVISNVVGPVLGLVFTLLGKLLSILANVVTGVKGFVTGIGGDFSAFGTRIQQTFTAIHDFIAGIITGVKTVIQDGFDFVKSVIQNDIDFVVGLFQWLYDHNTYFKDLVDTIKAVFTDVSNFIHALWDGIKAYFINVFDFYKGLFETVWNTISGIVKSVGGTILGDIKSAWNSVTSFIGGLAGAIGGAVNNGVISPIKNLLSNLASDAVKWGQNLMTMFISGITGEAGALKSAVMNTLGGLAKVLGFHSPAEEGPGADADTWAPNLMKMFAQGIVDATPTLASAAGQAMLGVRGALTGTATPGITGASGLVAPSASALLSQQIASAGVGVTAAGAGGQQAIIILDGLKVGTALLPHLGTAARIATGIRSY